MRKVIFFLLLALCLTGQATAAELPAELTEAAPEAVSLVSGDAGDGFGLLSGLETLMREALAEWKEELFSGVRAAAAIMAGVILLGVVESAAPEGRETLSRYSGAVGALWITAIAAGDLNALIGLGRETVTEISHIIVKPHELCIFSSKDSTLLPPLLSGRWRRCFLPTYCWPSWRSCCCPWSICT